VRIDGHVHFVGDGSNGSGCWLRSSTLLDRIVEPIVKVQAGISKSSRQLGIDQAYEQRLIGLIDDSSLDSVLLLAMDYPYDEDGNCLKEKAKFYVPNDHVLSLAKNILKSSPPVPYTPQERMQLKNWNDLQIKVPKC